MKTELILIAIFLMVEANAQNYQRAFAGTGESTIVNAVKVENLTKSTTLALSGGDILHLTIVMGVNSIEDNQSSELKIYPNPMTDDATMDIFHPVPGDVVITVSDMTGKQVALIKSNLENFIQDFKLSGIKNGLYFINVQGKTYKFSGKLISNVEYN